MHLAPPPFGLVLPDGFRHKSWQPNDIIGTLVKGLKEFKIQPTGLFIPNLDLRFTIWSVSYDCQGVTNQHFGTVFLFGQNAGTCQQRWALKGEVTSNGPVADRKQLSSRLCGGGRGKRRVGGGEGALLINSIRKKGGGEVGRRHSVEARTWRCLLPRLQTLTGLCHLADRTG